MAGTPLGGKVAAFANSYESMYGWIWVIGFYLLPLLVVEILTKKSVTNRLSLGRIVHLILCALPVGFAIGFVTSWPAIFCCNCFSFETYGPAASNHFGEDVMFSHSVSTAGWFSVWTHQFLWKKYREDTPSLLGVHVFLVLILTLLSWSAIGWTPPGCDHSTWR